MKSRTGSGRISACGGNGFAGGGGGRVAVDVFSRHDEPKIYVYGKTFPIFLPFFIMMDHKKKLSIY